MVRGIAALAAMLVALPAAAGEMNAQEARHFVIGKLFHYSCFEGTRGEGRVHPDGSVVGSIQVRGDGPVRYAALPANTLHAEGERICASLRGLPIQPCFYLERTSATTFRGSISGLGFAYCDFTRSHVRAHVVRTSHRVHTENPVKLRPSITADNN